jgi:hypothetical protein
VKFALKKLLHTFFARMLPFGFITRTPLLFSAIDGAIEIKRLLTRSGSQILTCLFIVYIREGIGLSNYPICPLRGSALNQLTEIGVGLTVCWYFPKRLWFTLGVFRYIFKPT